MKIIIAGTGYVGLSNAILLSKKKQKGSFCQLGGVPDANADVEGFVKEFDYKSSMNVRQGVKNFCKLV